jgi:hypothetical protein
MAKHLMQTRDREPRVLGSWKEIAAYLGKGVRTVQRWENDLGLPVRRPNGAAKGLVYAAPDELERWLANQWGKRGSPLREYSALSEAMRASRELRHANQQLVHELALNLESLRAQCEALAAAISEASQTRKLLEKSRESGRTRSKKSKSGG